MPRPKSSIEQPESEDLNRQQDFPFADGRHVAGNAAGESSERPWRQGPKRLFEIARQDLALRGPGEFLGARQSGVAMLKIADIERDQTLLEQARVSAEKLLHTHPQVVDRHLMRWLERAEQYLKV